MNITIKKPVLKATALLLFGALTFSACKKEKEGDLVAELSSETPSIRLAQSNFEIEYPTEIGISEGQTYNSVGEIQYIQNGVLKAEVNFGAGENDHLASITKDGETTQLDLSQSGKESEWTKVIEEPLVLSEECDEIVAGIIKYYKKTNGAWVATIDFGRGECDGKATKTAADWEGEYVFDIEKWSK
jgi:hypothetical protein